MLRQLGALGVDVEGVEGLTGGHEEAVFLGATEAEIGAGLGEMDFADESGVRREDVDAVVFFGAPAGGGPDVAVHIAADAVGGAGGHVHEEATILEVRAVHDVVDANGVHIGGALGSAGVHDVEFFFVGREANAVGLVHVGGDDGDFARLGIEAVDDGGEFEGGFVAFVVGHDAIAGIGEPNGAVGMDGEVVGGVEMLALKIVHEDGDGAVVLGARKAAGIVFASEEAALAVAVVAVAVVGGIAERCDFAGVSVPAEDAIVGNVAPQKIVAVAEPDRAFGPARAGVEAFDGSVALNIFCEARVDDFDRGIGIRDGIFVFLLARDCERLEGQRGGGAGGYVQEGASVH